MDFYDDWAWMEYPEEFDLREIFQERAPHPSALRLPPSHRGEGFEGVRVRGPPGNAG